MRTTLVLIPLLATAVSAQSLNVDLGSNTTFPAPSAAYAAAGFPGAWNAVTAPASAHALVGLDGAPLPATVSSSGGFLNFESDNAGTSGDDERLMDDCHDLGGLGSAVTWSFAGLSDGDYTVITYAWAPDSASFRTRVTVAGSADADQDVGGAWPGGQVLGTTYARHRVSVSGGTLQVLAVATSGFGSLNGIQIARDVLPAVVCAGDGSGTACPCGNNGASGNGCGSSVNASGGQLAGSGLASVAADTLVLAGSGMPDSSALYFQGTAVVNGGAGAVFGDGLRCAGGSVIRLGTQINAGGASQYPGGGDPAVSVRGACAAGDVRVYQVWYRNAAAFCQPEAFNLTNALAVTWGA